MSTQIPSILPSPPPVYDFVQAATTGERFVSNNSDEEIEEKKEVESSFVFVKNDPIESEHLEQATQITQINKEPESLVNSINKSTIDLNEIYLVLEFSEILQAKDESDQLSPLAQLMSHTSKHLFINCLMPLGEYKNAISYALFNNVVQELMDKIGASFYLRFLSELQVFFKSIFIETLGKIRFPLHASQITSEDIFKKIEPFLEKSLTSLQAVIWIDKRSLSSIEFEAITTILKEMVRKLIGLFFNPKIYPRLLYKALFYFEQLDEKEININKLKIDLKLKEQMEQQCKKLAEEIVKNSGAVSLIIINKNSFLSTQEYLQTALKTFAGFFFKMLTTQEGQKVMIEGLSALASNQNQWENKSETHELIFELMKRILKTYVLREIPKTHTLEKADIVAKDFCELIIKYFSTKS